MNITNEVVQDWTPRFVHETLAGNAGVTSHRREMDACGLIQQNTKDSLNDEMFQKSEKKVPVHAPMVINSPVQNTNIFVL